jgi:hypothetical protein
MTKFVHQTHLMLTSMTWEVCAAGVIAVALFLVATYVAIQVFRSQHKAQLLERSSRQETQGVPAANRGNVLDKFSSLIAKIYCSWHRPKPFG